jgi:hypothetical protein
MLGIARGVRADIECNWLATPNPPMVGSVRGALLLSDLSEFPGIGADFSGKSKPHWAAASYLRHGSPWVCAAKRQ